MKKNNAASPATIMHSLIQLSQKLVDLSEKETQSLLQNDMMAFSILQYEKETLTSQYIAVSEEFRSRLEEFRAVDRASLDRLETLQRSLAEKSHANNAIILKVRHRAQQNTQKTLFTVQELAQQKQVKFESTATTTEGI